MKRRLGAILLTLATCAACASVSDRGVQASTRALESLEQTSTSLAPPNTPEECDPAHEGDNATKSLRPLDQLPPPGHMPAGSKMAEIQQRGSLRVAIDDETLLLSYRNPDSGELEGFEWDLAGEIAQAISGDRDAVQANTVTTANKVNVVASDQVDITVSAVSMTCERWRDVLFSTPYYVAHQKVLVRTDARGNPVFPDGSPVPEAQDVASLNRALAGRKVCWTAGSTSIENIKTRLPAAIPYTVAKRTDCLKALQEGTVDAVSTHDTFLLGYHQQDPNTKIIDVSISDQTYAIAVSTRHPELVQFINRLLLNLRGDGLDGLYRKNFVDCAKCAGLGLPEHLEGLPEPRWLG